MSYLPDYSYTRGEFYMPRFKWDLLARLQRFYPHDKKLQRMGKPQLQAIYISARRKGVTSAI